MVRNEQVRLSARHSGVVDVVLAFELQRFALDIHSQESSYPWDNDAHLRACGVGHDDEVVRVERAARRVVGAPSEECVVHGHGSLRGHVQVRPSMVLVQVVLAQRKVQAQHEKERYEQRQQEYHNHSRRGHASVEGHHHFLHVIGFVGGHGTAAAALHLFLFFFYFLVCVCGFVLLFVFFCALVFFAR